MRLYPDSKVYIVCPGLYHTGGAELLHQLCSQLISFGVDAYMYYYLEGSFNIKVYPVDDFYRKYHLPYVTEIEDTEHNIFVAYEGPTEFLYIPKKAQRVLWWLSADNYLGHLSNYFRALIQYRKLDLEPLGKFFFFNEIDNQTDHLAQSEYAKNFLLVNGVPEYKIYMVEDYLNQAFLSRAAQVDLSRKENFVAYNPKKGFEVTSQLMNFAPDIDWRPIQNMTPEQVQELLARAKVYIDFGNHPGKDRIPREAAISGCVVITGKRGSAANDVDINIPAEFKFDERIATPQALIQKIRDVFDNFSAAHKKQAAYRARILDDKNRFANEVAEAFGIKNIAAGGVFIPQHFNEETFLLAEKLRGASLFIVDENIPEKFIHREQNRNYLRGNGITVEIITRDDAKFLYLEGRIKKFALLNPSEAELEAVKKFYAPATEDILIFNRE